MPTDDYDDDTTDDEQEEQAGRNPLRAEVRKLQKQLKERDADLATAKAATRELAFVKAGIDTGDKKAAYFVRAYDGDLTPEAIKAAAVDAGFLDADTRDVVTDKEKAGLAEIDRASGRGSAPGRRDIAAEMRALLDRTDMTPKQQRAALDALAAEGGVAVLQ